MSLHRFFIEGELAGGPVRLSPADLHHLRHVLRARVGEEFVLADGRGRQVVARLASLAEDASFELVRELKAPFLPDVTLVQGLARGPRMDLVVEKATEIGVSRIVPVATQRSVVKLDARGRREKAERWRRLSAAAAKQAQRAVLPRIDEVGALSDEELLAAFDAVLVPWEESAGEGIGRALQRMKARSDRRVAVVVGPEGGLDAAEVHALMSKGAVPVTLGGTILRTETAGIVACALTLYELGGLGGRRRG